MSLCIVRVDKVIETELTKKTLSQCRKCKSVFLINKKDDRDNSKWVVIDRKHYKKPVSFGTVIYKCKKCDQQLDEIGDIVVDVYVS